MECPSAGGQAAESSEESSLTISVVHSTGRSTSNLQPMPTSTVAVSDLPSCVSSFLDQAAGESRACPSEALRKGCPGRMALSPM